MRDPLTTRGRHVLALAAIGLGLGACPQTAPDEPPEPLALIDNEAWQRVVDPALDSFAELRPEDAVCDDAGWFYDPFSRTLEIETEVCNHPTLRQPTLEALAPGDVVRVLGYHDELTASEPATGYLGLAIAGARVLESETPIPAAAASFEHSFTVDSEVPAGSELQFHVHNHGPNTWELVAVVVERAEGQ